MVVITTPCLFVFFLVDGQEGGLTWNQFMVKLDEIGLQILSKDPVSRHDFQATLLPA